MATATTSTNTDSQLSVAYNYKNLCLGGNSFLYKTTIAATADDTTYAVGQIVAHKPSTDEIAKLDPTGTTTTLWMATPFGIVTEAATIDDTETVELRIVVSGKVDKAQVLLQAEIPYLEGADFNMELVDIKNY